MILTDAFVLTEQSGRYSYELQLQFRGDTVSALKVLRRKFLTPVTTT